MHDRPQAAWDQRAIPNHLVDRGRAEGEMMRDDTPSSRQLAIVLIITLLVVVACLIYYMLPRVAR